MNGIDEILEKVDFLGFNDVYKAKNAILSHPDWETRWDVSDLSEIDRNSLRCWVTGIPLEIEKPKIQGLSTAQGLSNPQICAIADVSYQLDGRFARRKADKSLQYTVRLVASAIVKELSGQIGVDTFAEEWMRLAMEGLENDQN